MSYIVLSFSDGETAVTLGDNYRYFTTPIDLTVVYMTCSTNVDDAGLTIHLNEDGRPPRSRMAPKREI